MPSLFQECYIQLTSSKQFYDTGKIILTLLEMRKRMNGKVIFLRPKS